MITNYFKVAFRNLMRNKLYSLINVLGLAIGLMACILILLYVRFELSYDRFHDKADRIYRIGVHGIIGGNEFEQPVTCPPLAKTLPLEFPEIEVATRVRNFGYPVLRYKDKVFSEERWFNTDSTFFEVFTVPFIQGDQTTALKKPNTAVITESMAQKYFGDENPIGKILNSDNRRDIEVVGVVEDFPPNSHFHFDFLGSLINYGDGDSDFWVNNNYYTYFVLRPGHDPKEVEQKLELLVRKYIGPQVQQVLGVSWEQLQANGAAYQYFIQPLKDIHLHSQFTAELEPPGNAAYVTIFSIIAIFILAIACINFMNLATARSARRAREVGIRKTLGSTRQQLISQFIAESVLTTAFAVTLAVLLVLLLLPSFNRLVNMQLHLGLFSAWATIPLLLATILGVGILAGSYPAFFLASFRPVKVLKSDRKNRAGHAWLRSGLVIFQFLISIALFASASTIFQQLNFMQYKDLGFNKDNLIIIEKTDDIGRFIQPFKQELLEHQAIIAVSNSNTVPGRGYGNTVHTHSETTWEDTYLLYNSFNDMNLKDVFQFEMAEGRFFDPERVTDSTAVVINETAVQNLGLKDPIGKYLIRPGGPDGDVRSQIIGVVKDFHYYSLHQPILPLALYPYQAGGFGRCTTVRIIPGQAQAALQHIEQVWHKYAGSQPFEYEFFDDDFNRLYSSEVRTRQIVSIFSGLAIFIACLGLFGLASFTTEQRTKEIGIRKAMGASIPGIFGLLTRDTLKLVLLAALIALPVSYYLMNSWLQNYAYRIGYSILGFFISTVIAGLIALLTISQQTLKAATANPVKALKYE
jgi:putative ABC transport system permease protein